MKRILAIAITLAFTLCMTSCLKKKEMAPEDFIKIQTEFLSSDQSDDSKEKIAQKYGFTAEQFTSFEERVESDIQLKTTVGEIRLKSQK